jgi:hypothetical protein
MIREKTAARKRKQRKENEVLMKDPIVQFCGQIREPGFAFHQHLRRGDMEKAYRTFFVVLVPFCGC